MANVGLNHRVGPNRSWVECARALAAAGFASLRFDLSGLGDSEPRSDARTEAERAVVDLQEALDFMVAGGLAKHFVLVGNCSGIDSLHTVSLRDPRVVGAVHIDGYAYRNFGFRWRWVPLRWLQSNRWRRRLRFGGEYRSSQVVRPDRAIWKRDIPSREQFGRDLETLLTRGVRLLLVYTGGLGGSYNHGSQFYECFGHRGDVDVEYRPRADHLLASVRANGPP